MKLNKFLDLYEKSGLSLKEDSNLHVIGTCGDCLEYVFSGAPEIDLGTCDSLEESTPGRCFPNFGCIHFEKKEV